SPVLVRDALHQLANFLVPILPYPFGEPRHCSAQFLATGAPFDDGVPARAAFLPAKFKSQEVKPPVVPASPTAKTQRLRLVQRQFQSELPKPFLNGLLERARLVPVIKAAHEVVRKAEQPALPPISLPHSALKPQVQPLLSGLKSRQTGLNLSVGQIIRPRRLRESV